MVVPASSTTTVFGQSVSADTPTVLDLSDLSGGLECPSGLAFDTAGDLFITDQCDNNVVVIPASSTTTVFGQSVSADTPVVFDPSSLTPGDPLGITLDPSGNLYAVDSDDNVVDVVPTTGTTSLYGQSVTANVPATLTFGSFDGWYNPSGFTYDSAGDVFVVNSMDNNVVVIAKTTGTVFGQSVAAGTPTILSPSGGVLSLSTPDDVAFDSAGDLFILNETGSITVVPASSTTTVFGQSVSADTPVVIDPSGFSGPTGIDNAELMTIDPSGNLYISNSDDGSVVVDPVATGTLFGQSVTAGTPFVFNPGGSLASVLEDPAGIAFDAAATSMSSTPITNQLSLSPRATARSLVNP